MENFFGPSSTAWPAVGAAIAALFILFYILSRVIEARSGKDGLNPLAYMLGHTRKPLMTFIVLLSAIAVLPLLGLHPQTAGFLRHFLGIGVIASVAWLGVRLAGSVEDYLLHRYDIGAQDNLRARSIHTQLQIIKRIVIVVICIVGIAAILMTFEKVRQLGTSILASAGIAGIILGLAAQRTISTIIAGLQIAITQPIRIDDVVIVENEWGRIEEITLTYVVVRIWDLRRLVLPITYFTEKPFQNWTRVTADILGTVFLYVDYTASVEEIRNKFFEILEQTDLWDGKTRGLQVTNATDRTMELRALMSAPDASAAWNLRCHVREKLVAFIQDRYPEALPQVRGVLREEGGGPAGQERNRKI